MPKRSRRKDSGGNLVGAIVGIVVLLSLGASSSDALPEGLNTALGGLVLIAIAVGIVWVAWRLWRRLRTPSARELARRFEAVRSMSGAQFEVFVADLFTAMGHKATVLGGSGDQGVDVIVGFQGQRIAVQCKNYKKAVGNRPVQEVYAGARHHRCQQAWVVAPAGYTKGAIDLARSTGVSLFDANAVRQWIREVDKVEKQREQAKETQPVPSHTGANRANKEESVGEARKRAFWHPHPDDPPPGNRTH